MKAYELRKKSEEDYLPTLEDHIAEIDAIMYESVFEGYFAIATNKILEEYECEVIDHLLEEGYDVTKYLKSGCFLISWLDAIDPERKGVLTFTSYFYADQLVADCLKNNIKLKFEISEEDLFEIQNLMEFIPDDREDYDLEELMKSLDVVEFIERLINVRGYTISFNDETTVCTIKYPEYEE